MLLEEPGYKTRDGVEEDPPSLFIKKLPSCVLSLTRPRVEYL